MSREAMLEVLEKAAYLIPFYTQLAENPQAALKDFDLTSEERAALTSGDVRFIESHTGRKLDERVMERVLIPLLSRERW
ncbi:hypothetical protein ES708_24305 [subsurface metagenome]